MDWHWRKLAGALGVGALLLTACGGATQSSSKPASSAGQTSNAKLTPVPNGTIVDGLFEEPNTLNPILGPSMTYAGMVETAMFRNLFVTLPSGKLAPDLATSVPSQQNGGISKNGLTYTISIKPNANWTNGKPVTVQDVITTWKLITNPKVTAWSTTGWEDIASIKALSSKKMQITLKHPDGAFLDNAFGSIPAILPASVFKNMPAAQVNKAKFDHDPTVSDGPFKFKSWSPGASITLVANPSWYGPKPKAQQIVFKVIPNDNTLLANAQAHEINVYYFDPIEQVQQLQAIKGATVHFTTQPAWESAEVNFNDPQMKDVRVRQALEMAINRQALSTKVWKGQATPVAGPAAPDQWDYNPALKPYAYNPAQAKQLLKQAGYTMGKNGYLEKNGQELKIVYSTTAGNPWRAADERLIQFWLKQVGVKMEIKNYPANAFFASVLPSGKGWDLGEFEWGDGADPAAGLESQWMCGASENFGSFCDHQLDTLLTSQNSMVNQSQRQPVLYKAVKILHDQLSNLWYYSPKEIDTSINMMGYTPDPFSFDTWNCYDWEQAK